MQRIKDLFDTDQRSKIETAVAQAETLTSCEIVPVVATSSGRYDRAADIFGLWLATIVACVAWWFFPRIPDTSGSWSNFPASLPLVGLIVSIIAAFILGAYLGSNSDLVRRLFTPQKLMKEEVSNRARQVYFDQRVHHTSSESGILIYLSLLERTAVIIGDRQVMDKLGQPFLDELCKILIDDLHRETIADALCHVIHEAGQRLSKPFPRQSNDIDELQNTLILMD
jgi:putative membrane protein